MIMVQVPRDGSDVRGWVDEDANLKPDITSRARSPDHSFSFGPLSTRSRS